MIDVKAFCMHFACMATLTIRNLPEELHQMLKSRAEVNRRSLNQQVIADLEALTQIGSEPSPADRWRQANALAEQIVLSDGPTLSVDDIKNAIQEGRR